MFSKNKIKFFNKTATNCGIKQNEQSISLFFSLRSSLFLSNNTNFVQSIVDTHICNLDMSPRVRISPEEKRSAILTGTNGGRDLSTVSRPCTLTVSQPSGRNMHPRPSDGTAWRDKTQHGVVQWRHKWERRYFGWLTHSHARSRFAETCLAQNFSTFLTIIFICWESHATGRQTGRQAGRRVDRLAGREPYHAALRSVTPRSAGSGPS